MFNKEDWEVMAECGECNSCKLCKKVCLFDIETFKEISIIANFVLDLINENEKLKNEVKK